MTFSASRQDGSYPRPQLVRSRWCSLDVVAGFAYDDGDEGQDAHWEREEARFDRRIQLPFAPESPASGIGDTGFHPIVWYRIPFGAAELEAAGVTGTDDRLLLHLGAVDYDATVWVDGTLVGRHEGGQTPFGFDVTTALDPALEEHSITVRAADDPGDVTTPRGKQDWQLEPHAIWYHRTTGIWRTVWLEAAPALRITDLSWQAHVEAGSVGLELELNRRPANPVTVTVELSYDDRPVASVSITTAERVSSVAIPIESQRNGQHFEKLLWSPEDPRLLDATVTVTELATGPAHPEPIDAVGSYLGLRSARTEGGRFLLNDRPRYLRSVLEQGYWPQSHFTAPSIAALREEVELILRLGFNSARIHQKVEDPRFLYWADRLGLLLWGETAGAYEFSATAVERLTAEWLQIVRRDRSHPSIVTWVPFNESWGIQHVSHSAAQRAYSRALTELTRALDQSRPVISNDGWEHTDSDILSIHDYEAAPEVLRERYASAESIAELFDGFGPAGRRLLATPGERPRSGKPYMLTEFGGVSYDSSAQLADSWGYSTAGNAAEFESALAGIVGAVRTSSALAGFCYTQLTDTRQETNGLCDENRVPKLPQETIARIVTGE